VVASSSSSTGAGGVVVASTTTVGKSATVAASRAAIASRAGSAFTTATTGGAAALSGSAGVDVFATTTTGVGGESMIGSLATTAGEAIAGGDAVGSAIAGDALAGLGDAVVAAAGDAVFDAVSIAAVVGGVRAVLPDWLLGGGGLVLVGEIGFAVFMVVLTMGGGNGEEKKGVEVEKIQHLSSSQDDRTDTDTDTQEKVEGDGGVTTALFIDTPDSGGTNIDTPYIGGSGETVQLETELTTFLPLGDLSKVDSEQGEGGSTNFTTPLSIGNNQNGNSTLAFGDNENGSNTITIDSGLE